MRCVSWSFWKCTDINRNNMARILYIFTGDVKPYSTSKSPSVKEFQNKPICLSSTTGSLDICISKWKNLDFVRLIFKICLKYFEKWQQDLYFWVFKITFQLAIFQYLNFPKYSNAPDILKQHKPTLRWPLDMRETSLKPKLQNWRL